MSDPEHDPGDQPTGRPTESGRRRARVLIPLGILLVAIALITYMVLVSQTGAEDDSDIYNSGQPPWVSVAAVVG